MSFMFYILQVRLYSMGQGVNCCTNQPIQDISLRQLQSLQNADASRQAIQDFFSKHPMIRGLHSKKPPYCTAIDRSFISQHQNMTCIGKIPGQGQVGQLIVLYKDGYYYQGEIKDFIREGCGRMLSADGDCYEGQWGGNQPQGEGTYQSYSPKRKYTGVWSGGALTGKGRVCYQDHAVYEGQFYQNQRHGRGRIQYADGTVYQGSFKHNLMEGFGTLIGINHKYEGSWKAGKMQGAGKSYWYNEDDELLQTYEGQYENGLKHGKGQYRWANGRVFAGQWEHGQIKKVNKPPPELIQTLQSMKIS